MKLYGILMKGEMVRAYLAGHKWMTRRTRGLDVINKNPDDWHFKDFHQDTHRAIFANQYNHEKLVRPPYGWVGDTLWFKETYAVICRVADPYCFCTTDEEEKANHYVEYRADTGDAYPGEWPEEEAKGYDEAPKWKSSMFMSRKYSRISVPVVNVQVQRVQDILLGDVAAEGWPDAPKTNEIWTPELLKIKGDGFSWFLTLWDSINAKRGMGWEENPWVFVYEFPKYSKLESTVLSQRDDMTEGKV